MDCLEDEKLYSYYEKIIDASEEGLYARLCSITSDKHRRVFLASLSDAERQLQGDRFILMVLRDLSSENKALAQTTANFLLSCCGEKGAKSLDWAIETFDLPHKELIIGIRELVG